jgi:pimeloyl-ACP methyl ester carboxylesterase
MGAVASALALADNPDAADGLILDSAYDRMSDAVTGWFVFLGGKVLAGIMAPTAWIGALALRINPFTFNVSDYLGQVKAPALVLHGTADTLAPPAAAEINFTALGGPKELVWFEGCQHSEARWVQTEAFYGAVLNFMRTNGWLSQDA